MVGGFLVFGGEGFDIFLVQDLSFGELGIAAVDTLGDGLGARLAVALGLEAVGGDAGGDEVVDYGGGAAVREGYVVLVRAVAVGV